MKAILDEAQSQFAWRSWHARPQLLEGDPRYPWSARKRGERERPVGPERRSARQQQASAYRLRNASSRTKAATKKLSSISLDFMSKLPTQKPSDPRARSWESTYDRREGAAAY